MIDQIRRFKYAQPFKPFLIELSSGDVVSVRSPDHIAFTESGTGIIVFLNDDDTFSAAPALHITGVGHFQKNGATDSS